MNGNGKMIELLQHIEGGLDRANERIDAVVAEQRATNSRLDQVVVGLDRANERLDQTNERLDRALEFLGTHHAGHEQRITALEDEVFGKRRRS